MYELLWRNKWLTADAKTIDDMIAIFEDSAETLREMKAAGVFLDADGVPDDYARLKTNDPTVAERFGMERKPWDDDELGDDDCPKEGGVCCCDRP